jgi:hypothetical protein
MDRYLSAPIHALHVLHAVPESLGSNIISPAQKRPAFEKARRPRRAEHGSCSKLGPLQRGQYCALEWSGWALGGCIGGVLRSVSSIGDTARRAARERREGPEE